MHSANKRKRNWLHTNTDGGVANLLLVVSCGRNVFNESVNGALLRDVVFLVYWSCDSRRECDDVGIATRVNGAAPPEVALTDIDLGSEHFWSLDDAVRDGAFATLRREAPI